MRQVEVFEAEMGEDNEELAESAGEMMNGMMSGGMSRLREPSMNAMREGRAARNRDVSTVSTVSMPSEAHSPGFKVLHLPPFRSLKLCA